MYHVRDGLHATHGGVPVNTEASLGGSGRMKRSGTGPGFYRYYKLVFKRRLDEPSTYNNRKFYVPEVVFNDRHDAVHGWPHAGRRVSDSLIH